MDKDEQIRILQARIAGLEQALQDKDDQIKRLQAHNARGAGRKRADARWTASYAAFSDLYSSKSASMEEIMTKLGISRATYYRYKRIFENN